MRIEIGNYVFNADRYCMWIAEKRVSEETGKTSEKRVTGYRYDFDKLLSDFSVTKALGSDAETMGQIVETVKSTMHDMLLLNEEAVNRDLQTLESIKARYGERP